MAEVPVGWKESPSFADAVIDDKFFCFKTPLSSAYDDKLTEEQKWRPTDVIKVVQDTYQRKIGLWIDLTNSDYFERSEVTANGIPYKKIRCLRDEFGFMRWIDVDEFMDACLEFLTARAPSNNSLIGVHCTHGLNRTGYVVCAYLVQCCGYTIQKAIAEFAICRPIGIFRQSLVDQLCKAYGCEGDPPPLIKASPTPSWIND